MTYQAPERRAGLRLHLNENTAGCSPRVLEALRSLTGSQIASYPDYFAVTSRVARYFGVEPGWLQLVNGLDEGLHVTAAEAAKKMTSGGFFDRKSHPTSFSCVVAEPAFEMYAICAEAVGLPVVRIAPRTDFAFPLDDITDAARQAAIVYLTDPNNPTGLAIPPGAIETIAQAAAPATVLVDEAYADFSGRTIIGPALERHRNLIVGRTFAKGHGLAALRIGALVAHPDALAPIRELLPPFSLNIAATTALEAALDDQPWLDAYVATVKASRERIYAWCDRLGFPYWRSDANFVLIRIGDRATTLTHQLAEQQIFIRDRSSAPGCVGCVRITAGTLESTDTCLTALEALLA